MHIWSIVNKGYKTLTLIYRLVHRRGQNNIAVTSIIVELSNHFFNDRWENSLSFFLYAKAFSNGRVLILWSSSLPIALSTRIPRCQMSFATLKWAYSQLSLSLSIGLERIFHEMLWKTFFSRSRVDFLALRALLIKNKDNFEHFSMGERIVQRFLEIFTS